VGRARPGLGRVVTIAPVGARPGADDMAIDVVPVPEPKTKKNRLHLDLRANGVSRDEELNRLLALGARRVDVGQASDVSWVVLADPEGKRHRPPGRHAPERTPSRGPGGGGSALPDAGSCSPPLATTARCGGGR
jgi:hypothetical protein